MTALGRRTALAAVTLTAAGALVAPTAAVGVVPADDLTETGTLAGGAQYALHAPAAWNGDLVVLPGREDLGFGSAAWLADKGYAVIGYELSDGWDLEQDRDNATAAHDVFAATVGSPEHTVVSGRSQGGLTTRIVVESAPAWLDGAVPMCGGGAGAIGMWNDKLDIAFALRELVDPGSPMRITDIDDVDAELAAMNALIEKAASTPEGEARVVLAAALGGIPVVDPSSGEPVDDLDSRIDGYIEAMPFAMGTHVRAGYEEHAGGAFSWNTGVDYAALLRASGRWHEVRQAYRDAGVSLDADLQSLAGAERLPAAPEAVSFVESTATYSGELSVPVLSMTTIGDPAGPTSDEDAYANVVRWGGSNALLRQTFVAADGHCTFTAAEEVVAFRTIFERIDRGRWRSTVPVALNRAGAEEDAGSATELGDARFVRHHSVGVPARMWDARNWGDYPE
ncbi:MAG: hypothetical protein ACTHZX_04275 [Microbacterium sp.]